MYDDHTMESYNLREKLLLNRRPGRAYDDEKRQKYEAGIYECSESKIRLGSSYQAEVPEWTEQINNEVIKDVCSLAKRIT
ncbi:hypothetical protein RIF29_15474 [Crotalaria pallida]|uniref:ELM2 domain-containing protein n=1 Tax=Crotalaria pallida TaxID=3830 RepID=A0AAN9IDL7_CROPI